MTLISKSDRYPFERQLKRTKRIFAIATIAFFAVAVVNMVTADYEYFWRMLFNVLLTIVYGAYAVYYVTALLPYRKAKCRFFTDWDNGKVMEETVEVVDQVLTPITKNRLNYYEANVVVSVNGKRTPRQLLLIDNTPLPTGRLFVKVFNNVVLEYKVCDEN